MPIGSVCRVVHSLLPSPPSTVFEDLVPKTRRTKCDTSTHCCACPVDCTPPPPPSPSPPPSSPLSPVSLQWMLRDLCCRYEDEVFLRGGLTGVSVPLVCKLVCKLARHCGLEDKACGGPLVMQGIIILHTAFREVYKQDQGY